MLVGYGAIFPKKFRLRKRVEFLSLSSSRHKFVVRGFLVVWGENYLQFARLGITANKKLGCAVVRNRVKRYLREFFRSNCFGMKHVDVNIIARRESAQMTYVEVVQELGKAFQSIGVSQCSRAFCSL